MKQLDEQIHAADQQLKERKNNLAVKSTRGARVDLAETWGGRFSVSRVPLKPRGSGSA